MLDISLGEILIILILTLLIVGPDQIPKVARTLGRALGQIRHLTEEFRFMVEESVREDEVRRMKQEAERRARQYRLEERQAEDGRAADGEARATQSGGKEPADG